MADQYDPMKDPTQHAAPAKTLVDKVIELALGAGGGAVTLLSGLLAAVLIMYSGYVLYDSFATERAASSNVWDLLQFKPEIFDDYETPLAGADLSEINRDYRAWLTVDGTSIDYPVVQGVNDTYYAAVDIYGRPSLTGAIYLAAANSPDFSDSYNVIYGHHMDSGAMFGALDGMSGNETGVIITSDEIYDVQFFAVAQTDAYESKIYSVGNRMNDVLAFLRSGGEGGVGVGTTVTYFNEAAAAGATRVVALSTCANASTSGRLVVFGKMTRRVVTVDVTIAKIWDDNDNQDGLRPESLTVTLSSGETAELNAANDWTATLTVPKFDSRGEIPYTWAEEAVTGYTLTDTAYDAETRTTTLTNSHTPEVTSVRVSKQWADDNNRDGIRPEAVVAVLSNGMTVELNENNSWTAEIAGLPAYSAGTAIDYTWTEEEVSGYSLTVDGDTLLNTHEPYTTDLTVVKVWNDSDNQDGLRPESVSVSLYGNEALMATLTLSEDNNWTAKVEGLYINEAGQPIAYTWAEETVPGYTLALAVDGAVTTLTNTHVPETIDLTVTKVWDDNNDQDGLRPGSLLVDLSDGSWVILNEANGWTDTLTGLPRYEAGQEIAYTWTEAEVLRYEQTGYVVNGNSTVITNRHETDTTVATVVKVWADDDNRDGLRPESLTVTLSNGEERLLNADNNWTATVTGLPLSDNGTPITYTWTEQPVTGYTLTTDVTDTTTTLTNTHEIQTVDLTVNKVWDDNGDQDGLRPDSVTVTLEANGAAVAGDVLSAANAWQAVAANLPANENGVPIIYTWVEETVPGYALTTETAGSVTTLTNTHTPETTALTVVKVWDDADNQDGLRPDGVTVTLSNGESLRLNEENNWTATVENLPVYANGAEIAYTWAEEAVSSYTLSAETDGNVTTLTNTHAPATTTRTVRKVWEDDNDRDALRPSTLAVTLLANGTAVRTASLNALNGWTATFADLPVYEAGNAITYAFAEEEVAGYTLTVTENRATTTLTNTHSPATTLLRVRKLWEDDNNRDAMRPETLTLTLRGDDESERQLTMTAAEGWSAAVEVPAYDRGREIHYTWTENTVPNYTGTQVTEGDLTTFTNTHVPATTTRAITKVWEDADNQDGLRPGSLTVDLLANNAPVETVVLSEDNNWSYTADALYVYENGRAISYSWREEAVPGYPTLSTATSGTLTTFTNTHVPEVTEKRVQKVWDDANNQDGLRPESLTVTLLANGEAVGSVVLNAQNAWTGAMADMPVYANGTTIDYTWQEEVPAGYTASSAAAGDTTILTNAHETERTVATVVKVWDDDDDRDGVRPASLTLTLVTGDTVELNADNNWTATVENLPKYADGAEIAYTWTEDEVAGYTLTDAVTEGTVTVLTNHHDIALQEITVVKVWDDDDNRDGLRPERLTATLNGSETVELSAENDWTATIVDQPIYANGGRVIIYRWTEETVPGYQLTREVEGTVTTLTNTHEPETVDLTVVKVWNDDDNRDGLRPDTLTLTLLADGEAVDTFTLTADNDWSATAEALPVMSAGQPIAYSWVEPEVAGYTALTETDGSLTTVTNTHEPATIDLTVSKVWVDGAVAARPAALNMILTASDGETRLVALSAANGWTATVTGLAQFSAGEELTYTWTEPAIAGYTQTAVVTNGTATVFTNTLTEQPANAIDYTLTVYYRYLDGTAAAPTFRGTFREGEAYDVASPVLAGYRTTMLRATGTMPARNVEYTVLYLPIDNTIIIDDIDTPLGLGQVYINIGDCLE